MLVRINRNKTSSDPEVFNNSGKCTGLVDYLEKENKNKQQGESIELWFNRNKNDITKDEVIQAIDSNKQGLPAKASKFFEININPSQKELEHMLLIANGNEAIFKSKFKEYVGEQVMDAYAESFEKRGIKGKEREIKIEDLLWFGKVEENRYYTHNDQEVKDGKIKKGEKKPGLNWHCHVIVSAKTADGKNKISPFSNDYTGGKGKLNGKEIFKGFSTIDWKKRCEDGFDKMYQYNRGKEERLDYKMAIKRGDLKEIEQIENDYKEGKNVQINQKLSDLREKLSSFQKLFFMNEKMNASKKYTILYSNGFSFQERNGDLIVFKKDDLETSIVFPNMNLNELLGRSEEENKELFFYQEYNRNLSDSELLLIKEMAKPEIDRSYENIDESRLDPHFITLYLDDKKKDFLKQVQVYRQVEKLLQQADKDNLNTLEKVNFLYKNGIIVKPVYNSKGEIISYKAGHYNNNEQTYANVGKLFKLELEVGGYSWKDYKLMKEKTNHKLYPALVKVSEGSLSGYFNKIKKAIDSVESIDRPLHRRLQEIWKDGIEKGNAFDITGARVNAAILSSHRTMELNSFSGKSFRYERKASTLEERVDQIEKRFEKIIDTLFADYTDYAEEAQAIKRRRRKDKEKRRSSGKGIGL